jgi:hypothetical protein
MEAWLLADKETLADYYGLEFLPNFLPQNPNVEKIPKHRLVSALEHASKYTQKRKYDKTGHGFALLKLINPAKVRQVSIHADRFFRVLEQEARRESPPLGPFPWVALAGKIGDARSGDIIFISQICRTSRLDHPPGESSKTRRSRWEISIMSPDPKDCRGVDKMAELQ